MDGMTRGMTHGFPFSTATPMGLCYSMNSALSEERKEVRLPIGRTESTVDRQNRSIDKDSVFTRKECNHTRNFIWCCSSADR